MTFVSVKLIILKLFHNFGYTVLNNKKAYTRLLLDAPKFDMMSMNMFLYFKRVFEITKNINGTVVECGVHRGWSLIMLAYLVFEQNKSRKVWGFDSFQGFPEPSVSDQSSREPRKGEHGDTSPEFVFDLFKICNFPKDFIDDTLTLKEGFFEKSLASYDGSPIAVLHIDVDLYESYKTVLNELYRFVPIGGVIMFDEYLDDQVTWPGAVKAIDEFNEDWNQTIRKDILSSKYYIIKS